MIEIGWEMPILLRAIIEKIPPEEIFQNWKKISSEIVVSEELNTQILAEKVDTVRDNWIDSDKQSWLALHRFYPGVIAKIKKIIRSDTNLYIVTTKGGRFVQELLEQEGVELPHNSIFGKECERQKYETLQLILDKTKEDSANLWFVEDRSKALLLVHQQPDLEDVGLYLADWGLQYRTREKIYGLSSGH